MTTETAFHRFRAAGPDWLGLEGGKVTYSYSSTIRNEYCFNAASSAVPW